MINPVFAAAAVGGVAALAALAVLLFFLCRKRRSAAPADEWHATYAPQYAPQSAAVAVNACEGDNDKAAETPGVYAPPEVSLYPAESRLFYVH